MRFPSLITASIALLAALIVSCAPADSGGDALESTQLRGSIRRRRTKRPARWPGHPADRACRLGVGATISASLRAGAQCAGLRDRRRSVAARRAGGGRRRHVRSPDRGARGPSGGRILGTGSAERVRGVRAGDRAHCEPSARPRRGSAVEPKARQSLLDADYGSGRSGEGRDDRDHAGPGHAGDRTAGGHEVHSAHPDAQRAAVGILGPRHVPWRARPGARGVRRPPRGPLPADGVPRTLPEGLRRFPHGAAGSGPRVRVQRALQPRLLQPDSAAGGVRPVSALDLSPISLASWRSRSSTPRRTTTTRTP